MYRQPHRHQKKPEDQSERKVTRLKENSVKIHANSRLTLIVAASYAVLSFLLVAIVIILGNTRLGRLITLNESRYEYSATLGKSIGQDDYFLFDAGIGFTLFRDSNRGINAEVLMQTAESEYTDSVNWNAAKLSASEIAISADVASEYRLKVGDVLYSRHIVDGSLSEYTVTQLLPYFPGTGISNVSSYSDGVIVMGYDSKYEKNISHRTIFFTNESIVALANKYSETPVDIVYRDDMIASFKGRLMPYLILLGGLGIVLTVAFIYALLNAVIYDYKRLIMLGFRKRDLNMAFSGYSTLPFVCAALYTAGLSVCLIHLMNYCLEAIWFLIVLLIVESLTYISASFIAKRQAWRA